MSDENVGGLVELLPCPGCGGNRTRVIGGPGTKGGPKFWAGCDLCRWRTWGNTEEDAILSWNTRVSAHGQPVVDGRTLYDHRTAVDAAVRRAAPALYHALKNLLEAVEERPDGMGIETATLADARQALSAALKGADHE